MKQEIRNSKKVNVVDTLLYTSKLKSSDNKLEDRLRLSKKGSSSVLILSLCFFFVLALESV
jgi:hypothetical protein